MQNGSIIIPELLTSIFEYSSQKSNAVNAQVCKVWFDSVKPVLWSDVESTSQLKALFIFLGPRSFSTTKENVRKRSCSVVARRFFSKQGFPGRPDWGKFLSYASFIRSLTFKSEPQLSHVLHFVSETCPVSDPFPNLHKLACNLSDDSGPSPLCSMFAQGRSRLKLLILDFTGNSSPELRPSAIPPGDLSGLQFLQITADADAVGVKNLLETIQVLGALATELEELIVRLNTASSKLLEAASRLPKLVTLKSFGFHEKNLICRCDGQVTGPTFNAGCFPVLETLTIAGCANELSAIVRHPQFLANISTLEVDYKRCHTKIHDLRSFHQSLANNFHNITAYYLYCCDDSTLIKFGELRPLLSLKLVSFMIAGAPLIILPDELQELVTSLTHLKTLYLSRNLQPPTNNSPRFPVGNTMDMLSMISRSCRQLESLGLYVNTSSFDVPVETILGVVPFSDTLHTLDLGISPLAIKDSLKVAMYLAHVVPEGCNIDIERKDRKRTDLNLLAWTALILEQLPDLRKIMKVYGQRRGTSTRVPPH